MPNLGLYAQLACIWEATARKPGNVHPERSFADLHYIDFLHSAAAAGPILERAPLHSVGETVLSGVQATRVVTATNTNLGVMLLLAPLAKVPPSDSIDLGIGQILKELSIEDSRLVQQAIRIAKPGGLGEVAEHDLNDEPTLPLQEWMRFAQDRDSVARQYANDFHDVLHLGMPALQTGLQITATIEQAIIRTQLAFLSKFGDSLIARKCGADVSQEACRLAKNVADAGWPHSDRGQKLLQELDAWLRADGNRRNPGTTADLVTACLFVALREGIITLPLDRPFTTGI